MILLTPAVYWSNLKVDNISGYPTKLARSNISENPMVSIVARLLCMQFNNAAVKYRLHKARQLGLLTKADFEERAGEKDKPLCDTE